MARSPRWPDTPSFSTLACKASLARTVCTSLLRACVRAGTVKKGKAARQAIELMTRAPDTTQRERDLVKAIPDMDGINALVRDGGEGPTWQVHMQRAWCWGLWQPAFELGWLVCLALVSCMQVGPGVKLNMPGMQKLQTESKKAKKAKAQAQASKAKGKSDH